MNAGLVDQLKELGWQVKFDGHHQFEEINALQDPPIGILKNPRLVSKVSQAVADVVGAHVGKGELPVTIGGDHSLVSFFFILDTVKKLRMLMHRSYCRLWVRFLGP